MAICSGMKRLIQIAVDLVRAVFKPKAELVVENLALRQQVAVLKEKRPRPKLTDADRLFWVLLRRLWPKWSQVLIVVKPETVVRWHRAGFRAYWRWRSRPGRRGGRPTVPEEVRDLVHRLARENVTWGAPRIHGELLKLGFDVSERTVLRYMPRRPTDPDAVERWKAFLRNHAAEIAAMDFFAVPTATFGVLYGLFVIHHGSRRIVHANVTAHPTSAWVAQQMREAFPFDEAPRFLIHDRDSKFGLPVADVLEKMGVEPIRTSYRSPSQNGTAERWVGSCRREMLDHVVPLGEDHLRRLVLSYVRYHNEDRTHLGLGKETPSGRATSSQPSRRAKVVSLPRCGGLHHRYEWSDAA